MKHSANALIAAAKRDAPRRSLEAEVLGALGAGTLALAPSFGAKLWMAIKHAAVSKTGIATIAFAAATGGYAAGRLQERAIQATQTPTQTPTQTQTPTLAPTAGASTKPTLTSRPTGTARPKPSATTSEDDLLKGRN